MPCENETCKCEQTHVVWKGRQFCGDACLAAAKTRQTGTCSCGHEGCLVRRSVLPPSTAVPPPPGRTDVPGTNK